MRPSRQRMAHHLAACCLLRRPLTSGEEFRAPARFWFPLYGAVRDRCYCLSAGFPTRRGQGRRRWHRPTGWGCTSNLPPSGDSTSPAGPPRIFASGTAESARLFEALWCAPPVGTRRPVGTCSCVGLRQAFSALWTTCGQLKTHFCNCCDGYYAGGGGMTLGGNGLG